MDNIIQLTNVNSEPRVDSVEIAKHLGIAHRSAFRLVSEFLSDFEELGQVRFEIAAVKTPGGRGTKNRKFALLNEDQCYLLLSYSRNTAKVRGLKLELVKAFGAARRQGLTQALSVYQELVALQRENADSLARASFGSHLMLDRKRQLPALRGRQHRLEAEFAPQLRLVS